MTNCSGRLVFVPSDFCPVSLNPPAIIAIVTINAVIGVVQEARAEAALDALKNMTANKATVIRDGHAQIVDGYILVIFLLRLAPTSASLKLCLEIVRDYCVPFLFQVRLKLIRFCLRVFDSATKW